MKEGEEQTEPAEWNVRRGATGQTLRNAQLQQVTHLFYLPRCEWKTVVTNLKGLNSLVQP